ncbi:MAG: RNA degradosome polyphosphate kinase, partial [Chitinivibrionales bacterium]|nr:RNA degradosome polyphosphate kinase [Chitinivibrionales bacterium]
MLERLKFLAITGSNLDEFFMVRVGGLRMLVQGGITRPDSSGLSPVKQLGHIDRRVREMVNLQYDTFNERLKPRLEKEGIRRITPERLSAEEFRYVEDLFSGKLSAMITPMAIHS